MKKLLVLTLTGMLACAGTAFAADAVAQKKGGQRDMPSIDQRMEMMTKQLDLTAEQQPKVKALLEEQAKEFREMRGKLQDATPEQRREKMVASRETFDKKMKAILTPAQYEKLQQRRPSRGEGGFGGEKKGEKRGKKGKE